MAQIDLESDGKRMSYLPVPISTHESAYGQVRIQVGIVKSGKGPRVLLVGGNHGDEYEGQIALRNLWQALQPEQVTGTVILIAAANRPAVEAGRRTSPLDKGNLNRSFPGNAARGVTEAIAAMIHSLLPSCDFVLDLHSGGSSLHYLPCVIFGRADNNAVLNKQFAAARAFGAPMLLSFASLPGSVRSLSGSAIAMDIPAIATELGGSGSVSRETLDIAANGTWRFLDHVGAVTPRSEAMSKAPMQELAVPDETHYVYCEEDGIFEPAVELGARVEAGETAGHLHPVHDVFAKPRAIVFQSAGIVVCRSARARVRPGDCLFHSAIPA